MDLQISVNIDVSGLWALTVMVSSMIVGLLVGTNKNRMDRDRAKWTVDSIKQTRYNECIERRTHNLIIDNVTS